MTEDRPNARRHPRYAVQVEAQVDLGGQRVHAVTKDLSRGGICLVCSQASTAGSRVHVSLALVLGTNSFAEGLDLVGRVIWCTPMGAMFQLGLVFTEMAPPKLGQLEMFLRFLQQEILVEPEPAATKIEDRFDTGDADDA